MQKQGDQLPLRELPSRFWYWLLLATMAVSVPIGSLAPPAEITREREQPGTVSGQVFVQIDSANPATNASLPIANTIVYLDSTENIKLAVPKEPLRVQVSNKRLNPRHSCVVVGQQFLIETQDENRYSFDVWSPNEPRFGAILPPNPLRFEKVFTRPHCCGLIRCNIHPEVRGYVSIAPNPVFTWTGNDGSFRLPHPLPPGKYRLVAFHPRYGRAFGHIVVNAGKPVEFVKMVLPLSIKEAESDDP